MESGPGERSTCGVVVGLLVNRAKEVGIAAFDPSTAELHLHHLIETSRTFQNTVNVVRYYNPGDLLVTSGTIGESPLQHIPTTAHIRTAVLPRSMFDDAKGSVMVQNLARPGTCLNLAVQAASHYLSFASAAAVLRWMEKERSCLIMKESLKVTFNGCPNHLLMNFDSAVDLGVLSADMPGGRVKKELNLFNLLNNAHLESGTKLLRANCLQPLKDIPTINTRLNSLEELLDNEALYSGLERVLQRFPPNLDRNLLHFAVKSSQPVVAAPAFGISRRASAILSSIILLKETLVIFPDLAEALEGASSDLLKSMQVVFRNPILKRLQERIQEVIDDDVLHSRAPFASRAQQCFAVKSGVDGYLDVSRTTFCATTDAVHNLGKVYREKFSLPSLKLPFNARRGFYISISSKDVTGNALPKIFSQVTKVGKNIHCTTQELASLNTRNKDAARECYWREEKCLEDLCSSIREQLAHLSMLVESVSLLDVLLNCFASLITTASASYVRPEFTEDGPMAIDGGRHPVLERIPCAEPYVPNKTFLSSAQNMILVTGPNMSGKSTYLRQVALIAILGHIGCYVPARFASLRRLDTIFTRLGTEDSIEANSSTFMTEMRETAHLMSGLTDRSLVVIDELGRATSTSDGLCLAWSCCEYLLASPAFCLFATHMHQLETLPALYPNVKCCHLSVSVKEDSLCYQHLLKDGRSNLKHYGISLAKDMGMPLSVIDAAMAVAASVEQQEACCFYEDLASGGLRQEYHVAQKLNNFRFAFLSEEKLCQALQKLRETIQG